MNNKVTNTKTEKQSITFSVSVDSTEWQKVLKQAEVQLAKKVKIDGFRPGKVPLQQAKKYLNPGEVFHTAINKKGFIDNVIVGFEKSKEFEKHSESILDQPQIDVSKVDDKEVIFDLIYDLVPEVEVEGYKNLKLESKLNPVSEADVNNEIERLLNQDKTIEVKQKGELEKGDIAVFDFTGFKNNEKFAGGEAKNYELEIGSNAFIPGFEDQMVGMKLNEERDLNLTFPKDYGEKSLAGQDVVFKVKLNEIKQSKKPVLNDEWVKTKDKNLKSVDDFKKIVKQRLETQRENEFNQNVQSEVVKHLLTITKLSYYPETTIKQQENVLRRQMDQQLRSQGLDLETYLKLTKADLKEFEKQLNENAKNSFALSLAVEKIADLEKIDLDDKEIDKEIQRLADMYKIDVAKVKEQFDGDAYKWTKIQSLVIEKVREYASSAKPNKPAPKKATTSKSTIEINVPKKASK